MSLITAVILGSRTSARRNAWHCSSPRNSTLPTATIVWERNASAIAAIGSTGVWALSAANAITITAEARNRRVVIRGNTTADAVRFQKAFKRRNSIAAW